MCVVKALNTLAMGESENWHVFNDEEGLLLTKSQKLPT